ncbi:IclR family transcriptional regulator [Anaerobacillus sp. MEB173]|uniref:IclR family transcriptional regulator n=1 Tax=Anaerobacillus sp. MEB173 TaxID=3383345 RepID=UPI003F8F4CAB
MTNTKTPETVQSVERAIDLLYCFSLHEPELSINDFVGKTGLNRTTVFRLLTSLKEKKLIIKDEERGTYKLGLAFVGFGQIVSENLDIRKESLQELRRLSSLTKETVSINVLQANRRVCVEKVDGSQDIRQFVKLGFPYPLLKGASGKVLLAFCEASVIEKVIEEWVEINSEPFNRDQFMKELQEIRDLGYCLSKNDRVFGAYSISTPIFNAENELIAGLSISGLSMRLTEEKEQEFITQVINGAREISKKMGYIS